MKPLEPRPSLTERAYRAILDEIASGALPPGDHLVQEEVARKLGVSRQPVQQALALLKNDGLVVETGGRGLRVAPLDLATMRSAYQIRAALDALAARLAAGRAATEPAFAEALDAAARPILAAGRAAVAAGDVARMVALDVAFHETIYARSGNPLLSPAAEAQWRYLRRCMSEVLRRAEPPPEIWRQHEAILEAILRGDASAAAEAAERHVDRAAVALAASFPGAETAPPLVRRAVGA